MQSDSCVCLRQTFLETFLLPEAVHHLEGRLIFSGGPAPIETRYRNHSYWSAGGIKYKAPLSKENIGGHTARNGPLRWRARGRG